MSTKGTIFKTIADHLMQNVNGLKMVDKDKGQLDNNSEFVIPLPAVFLSFGRFDYEDIGGGMKQGEGTIRFRVAYENYADSHTGSINQDQALAFFDFNEAVQEALEGFSGQDFSALTLVADEDDEDHKNIIITIMEYETTINNRSGKRTKNYIKTDAVPSVKYVEKEKIPQPKPTNDFIIKI